MRKESVNLRAAVPLVMASWTFRSMMTPAKSDLGYKVPIGTYNVFTLGKSVCACASDAHDNCIKYIMVRVVGNIMVVDTQPVSSST